MEQQDAGRNPGMAAGHARSRSAPGHAGCRTPSKHTAHSSSSGAASEWRMKTPSMHTPTHAAHKPPLVAGGCHARSALAGPAASDGRNWHRPGSSALPPRMPIPLSVAESLREMGAQALGQSRQRNPCTARLSPRPSTSPQSRAQSATRGRRRQAVPAALSPRSVQDAGSCRNLSLPRTFASQSPRPGAGHAASDTYNPATAQQRSGQRAGSGTPTEGWRRFLDRRPVEVPKSGDATTLADRLRAAQACTSGDRVVSRLELVTGGMHHKAAKPSVKHHVTAGDAGSRTQRHTLDGATKLAYVQARPSGATRPMPLAVNSPAGRSMSSTPTVCLAAQIASACQSTAALNGE